MRLPAWMVYLLVLVVRFLPVLLLMLVFLVLGYGWYWVRYQRQARLDEMIEAYRPHTREELEAEREAVIAAPRPPLPAALVADLARLGRIMAMPPLRPRPTTLAPVSLPASVSGIYVAEEAGVALVDDYEDRYLVIDLGSGAVISRGEGRMAATISPNGRVIGVAVDGGTELRDAQTGAALMTLPAVTPSELRWIDRRGLMHTVYDPKLRGGDRLVFRDFATGVESSLYLPRGDDGLPDVVPMPGQRDRFALLQRGTWTEMTLTPRGDGWVAAIAGSRTWSGTPSGGGVKLSADGRYHLSTPDPHRLVVVDIAAGSERVVNLGKFVVLEPLPTADPDKVLLRSTVPDPIGGQIPLAFLYSLSSGLLAQIPADTLPQRLFFLRPPGVLAGHDAGYLRPLALPEGTTPSEVGLALALADPGMFTVPAGAAPPAPAATPPVLQPVPAPSAAVAELVQGARLVGVGVYEPRREPPPERSARDRELEFERMKAAIENHDYETLRAIQHAQDARDAAGPDPGSVRVRVLRTKQPTVLVLSSYESVRWVVSVDPGADVRGILLSGYERSSVIGTALPVYRIGTAYAFDNGETRQALDAQLREWTGRSLDAFQGQYAGDNFMVLE